jgi:hypothetical protein
VVVDGSVRSSHARYATAIEAAEDSLWIRPNALVELRADFDVEWRDRNGRCQGPVVQPPPTDTASVPLPDTPGTPQFTATEDRIDISWEESANADGYQLGWAGGSDTSNEAFWSLPATWTGWFCTQAFNAAGLSADQSCNTYNPPEPPVSALTAIDVIPSAFTIDVGETKQLYPVGYFTNTPGLVDGVAYVCDQAEWHRAYISGDKVCADVLSTGVGCPNSTGWPVYPLASSVETCN